MKKLFLTLAPFLLLSCKNTDADDAAPIMGCFSDEVIEEVRQVEGHVEIVGNTYVIETESRRYYPCDFPSTLTIQGKQVVFDASLFAIPPHFRLVGQPIRITRIY
ncbi:hypothetical protein FVR03_07735 [Pontibacter qinzhouensis]|uniref:Lipoprotein n=1 Tax=Pontibacter qinzhouensis TaxID=2603253 RepID=A0A5C8KBY6_9BACT|nr:hypothetical protein [Pontibacter qinzhouensis]TXK48742.1 hypothetical protein FVR03_07735 [Pontibacter qinzhouensis]